MQFEIVTDSSCNLPDELIDEYGLHILPLTFMSEGEQFKSYVKGEKSDLKRFFDMMRNGKVFTTSLPNQEESLELIESLLAAGKDVLYIGFSSGLSGTYQAIANLMNSFSACSGLLISVRLPQVFTTPTRKNKTSSASPIALTAPLIWMITCHMPPPLKLCGDMVSSDHTSAILLFHVSSAFCRFCTTQLSLSKKQHLPSSLVCYTSLVAPPSIEIFVFKIACDEHRQCMHIRWHVMLFPQPMSDPFSDF